MASARCTWHPDRSGVAVCVDCRRVVCPDCATVVDGLHCCIDCLERRAERGALPGAGPADGWTRRAVAASFGWWGLVSLLAWAWYSVQLAW